MTPYAQLPTNNPEEFMRTVGLSKEDFQQLNRKLADTLSEQKALNPLTRRGRKDSKLALEDRLLLTIYYLRHYPTLANLGRSLASTSHIAIRFIPAPQGCWPKSLSNVHEIS